jgi:PleD family two-component response regulator
VATLLAKADTAMYHAKRGGRNSVRFFEQEMLASASAVTR